MRDWAIDQAVEGSKSRLPARAVLIVIAGHYNPATGVAYPGTRTIARKLNCSTSTVARAIRSLVADGDLVIVREGRGTRSTVYRIPALDGGPLRSVPSEANANDDPAFSPEANASPDPGALSPGANASGPLRSPSVLPAFSPEANESKKREIEITQEEEIEKRRTLERDLDRPRAAFADVGALGIAQARSALAPPLRSVEEDPR